MTGLHFIVDLTLTGMKYPSLVVVDNGLQPSEIVGCAGMATEIVGCQRGFVPSTRACMRSHLVSSQLWDQKSYLWVFYIFICLPDPPASTD